MRLQQIEIPAFGPFTNLELTFPDQPGDLHVIYGANEAGKSSLLRAIRDLLFGIQAQSPDNFLHEYKNLRIKGRIRNRTGAELCFQRRKGNKSTLLDADGGTLPDAALETFLGSVDQTYFSTMFGLGARELRDGAKQLLRGEGAMGQALFSASMGGTPVQKVLDSLQAEADRIFKGRATANVTLRPAVNSYKELIKQSRDAVVGVEKWEENEQALAKAAEERRRLEDVLAKLESELAWIERCETALPIVGELAEETEKLALLPTLPEVAGDFIVSVRAKRGAAEQAQRDGQALAEQLGRLRTQLDACIVDRAVLAEAGTLERLHRGLDIYRERKAGLATLREQLAGLETTLAVGMCKLGLNGTLAELGQHRLGSAAQLACEESAEALQAAQLEESKILGGAETLPGKIAEKERELAALPEKNLEAIREALAVAAEATDAAKTLATSETELQRHTRTAATHHRALAGAPADFEETVRLPVPSVATIRRHKAAIEKIASDIDSEEKAQREAQKRVRSLEAELARLQRQGELPTETALTEARRTRDRGWQLVLAEWKGEGAKEELEPGTPLEEAFPRAVDKADTIADRLRLEAEAVAQAEEKRLQTAEARKMADESGAKLAELRASVKVCDAAWAAEWKPCGFAPRSPEEMEAWREQWSRFCDSHAKLVEARETVEKKSAQVRKATERLAAALGGSTEKEFAVLFAAARTFVQEGEQAAGERKALAKQLNELRAESTKAAQSRERLQAAVASATENWGKQCVAVGLPEGTSPKAGVVLLRERRELLGRFEDWKTGTAKSTQAGDDVERYEREVATVAAALGIAGVNTEALESALWTALEQAREADRRHKALTEQREQAEAKLAAVQKSEAEAEEALGDLARRAGVATAAELDPVLTHLERRDAARAEIDRLRKELSRHARGQGVDEFVAKVRSEAPSELADRKAHAALEKQELARELEGVRQTVFGLEAVKAELVTAGDKAADLRQQAEAHIAVMAREAARFLRLRLATHLVQEQIERFREENQGPLLLRAGAIFRAITGGAFVGLVADFDANDTPVLVGCRPDHTTVTVEGLSDGSRDQLYLSLRLAALERFLEEHEPMPLILDDLLITFDNDRARAILPQLGELGKRTQILLFTHHEHLVDLCRETLGENHVHIHRLGVNGGTPVGT